MKFRLRLFDLQVQWGREPDEYVEKTAAFGFTIDPHRWDDEDEDDEE